MEFLNIVDKGNVVVNTALKKLQKNGSRRTAYGYIVMYKDEYIPGKVYDISQPRKRRAVMQYTLDMQYVAEHKDGSKAALSIDPIWNRAIVASINSCCRLKTKQYKGYIWRYKNK